MTLLLEVEDLTIHFDMIAAADNLNVAINTGEVVGIIGPNGAGKTTFLNLVTGYLKPQKGRIMLMGKDIVGLRPHEITAMGVARSFQMPQLFLELTVLENILVALATGTGCSLHFWRPLKNKKRINEAHEILDRLGIDEMHDRLAGEISEGDRKLLDVAMAFALKPKLLFMDEPTSGVSTEDKFQVMDTLMNVLNQSEVTTVFIEHDMSVVQRYAKRVLVLSEGKVVADGHPEAILKKETQSVQGVEIKCSK
ncbi:MAG: ABC transporter ATP-binding protein [Bacillota bacterium]